MHEINALRQANADLTDRITEIQQEAARKAYHAQQQIDQLHNENFGLVQNIKRLKLVKVETKPVIKREIVGAGAEDFERIVKVAEEQKACIKKLEIEIGEEKAHVCSLRVQLDCLKGASQGVKQQLFSANAKIHKSEHKLDTLTKKTTRQEREIKKLKGQDARPASKKKPLPFKAVKNIPKSQEADARLSKSLANRLPSNSGSCSDKMDIDQDEEDDEEDLPLAQRVRMKREAMEVDNVSMATQRVNIKQEKASGFNQFHDVIVLD